MARDSKDKNWHVGNPKENGGYTADTIEHVQVAVLMDIRDELKEIKDLLRPLRRLDCPDFLKIPHKLDRIGKNTEKKTNRRGAEAQRGS